MTVAKFEQAKAVLEAFVEWCDWLKSVATGQENRGE